MEIKAMYEQLGISRAVYEYGERVLRDLRPRFDAIDQMAEFNQGKVIAAMQKNRVNATHFAATTGYGYDDEGRANLERVYADVFHTEAALVRPQITCGTHALAVALSANLLPGDELLSPVGAPYDTLEEVIGIRQSQCSLREYGVTYAQAELTPDGAFDYDAIRAAINDRTKLITIQRSKGLGENDAEMMWLTTMNPETRRLIKVTPEDAKRTGEVFDLLLGDNLAGRKEHIANHGYEYLDELDVS